ncbi:hypothetical protein ACFWXO_32075 [Kitasatospora sp. NPDC059088]|uniref:hypothetical protein n=1 Tax=Kitasatospora sp. NPDC059088 TaxID=3346722 RepID=UPI0036767F35
MTTLKTSPRMDTAAIEALADVEGEVFDQRPTRNALVARDLAVHHGQGRERRTFLTAEGRAHAAAALARMAPVPGVRMADDKNQYGVLHQAFNEGARAALRVIEDDLEVRPLRLSTSVTGNGIPEPSRRISTVLAVFEVARYMREGARVQREDHGRKVTVHTLTGFRITYRAVEPDRP